MRFVSAVDLTIPKLFCFGHYSANACATMKARFATRKLVLLNILVVLAALRFRCLGSPAAIYQYTVPKNTNDGWQTADLSSEHIDRKLIEELLGQISDNTFTNIHSVLIVKNGKLVLEAYFPGRDSSGQYHIRHSPSIRLMR
jgi:hypothetical protein